MFDFSHRIESTEELLKLKTEAPYLACYRFFDVIVMVKSNALQPVKSYDALFYAFREELSIHPHLVLYIMLDEEQKTSLPCGPLMLKRGQIVYEIDGEFWEWCTLFSPIPPFLLPPLVTRLYFIHAGAVCTDRKALILPADPGDGKTTLTLALVRKGCKLLSDENAIINPLTLQVYPFPRALSVRRETIKLFTELSTFLAKGNGFQDLDGTPLYFLRMEKLYPGCIGERSKVKHIVFPKYEPTKKTELIPLARSKAVFRLLQNSMTPSLQDLARAEDVLTRLVRDAECYSLLANNVEDATTVLLRLIGKNERETWEVRNEVLASTPFAKGS